MRKLVIVLMCLVITASLFAGGGQEKTEMTAPATGAPRELSTQPTNPPPSSARTAGVNIAAASATGPRRRLRVK